MLNEFVFSSRVSCGRNALVGDNIVWVGNNENQRKEDSEKGRFAFTFTDKKVCTVLCMCIFSLLYYSIMVCERVSERVNVHAFSFCSVMKKLAHQKHNQI